MSTDPNTGQKAGYLGKLGKTLGWIAIWTWAIVAGGGGFLLLLEKGPLPLTNGWFAMLSGVAICPLTAMLLKKFAGIMISIRIRIAAAVLFFIAGRIALLLGI
jgi:hypothetical protein